MVYNTVNFNLSSPNRKSHFKQCAQLFLPGVFSWLNAISSAVLTFSSVRLVPYDHYSGCFWAHIKPCRLCETAQNLHPANLLTLGAYNDKSALIVCVGLNHVRRIFATRSTGTAHTSAKGRWRNDVTVAMAIPTSACCALQRRAAQSLDTTFRIS